MRAFKLVILLVLQLSQVALSQLPPDGSRPPSDCSEELWANHPNGWLFFRPHQTNCSRFWMCEPPAWGEERYSLHECDACNVEELCNNRPALTFDINNGMVCTWPTLAQNQCQEETSSTTAKITTTLPETITTTTTKATTTTTSTTTTTTKTTTTLPETTIGTLEEIVVHATCDNFLQVVIDEDFAEISPSDNNWRAVGTFTIPPGSQVLAISCRDDGESSRGLLGSLSNGEVTNTDGNWVCSSVKEEGWWRIDFDDSHWSIPESWSRHGSPLLNGATPWGIQPQINATAQWIWTGSSDSANGGSTDMYCRYDLAKTLPDTTKTTPTTQTTATTTITTTTTTT